MVRIGTGAPMSRTKSNPPAPTSGSRLRAQNSRTLGSSCFIRRGVKARPSRLRWRSWVGGSSKMIEPAGSSIPLLTISLMISRTEPLLEMYVSQSTEQRRTSSKRLRAWKS